MTMLGPAALSMPTAKPAMMLVPCPVGDAGAIPPQRHGMCYLSAGVGMCCVCGSVERIVVAGGIEERRERPW